MRRWFAGLLAVLLAAAVMLAAPGSAKADPVDAEPETGAVTEPAAEPTGDTDPEPTGEPEPTGDTDPEPTGETEPAEEPLPDYVDVSGHWAEADILLLRELGLMNGVSDDRFAPDAVMSRAMFVTVLHRLHRMRTGEEPESVGEMPFADVPAESWYTEAVWWAWKAGIVQGVTDTSFRPAGSCTREQSVVLVRRYLNYIGVSTHENAYLGGFSDSTDVDLYARGAMSWAVGAGLIQGTDLGKLLPLGSLTRAQFAAVAVRLLGLLDGTLPTPETEPWPDAPTPSATQVEVDRIPVGRASLSGGVRYIGAGDLMEACGFRLTMGEEDGVTQFRLSGLGQEALFCDGFADARTASGRHVTFAGPALCLQDDCYIPASAIAAVFDRTEMYDRGQELLRYLPVTGCEIRVNGVMISGSGLCEAHPVAAAAQLAGKAGGSCAEATVENGIRTLTLTAAGHKLVFRDGEQSAVFDGAAASLPIPAWKDAAGWHVPAEAAGKALGYAVCVDSASARTDLLKADSSLPLWFGGVSLGNTPVFGRTPMGAASKLASAVGGSVKTSGNTLTFTALGHTLVFRADSFRATANGASLELPLPVVRQNGEWLVPLRPLAQKLGMSEVSPGTNKLVFSRMKTCGTTLWADGKKYPVCGLLDGVRYMRLNDTVSLSKATLTPNGNTAVFKCWGKTVTLTGGSKTVKIGSTSKTLSAPVLADGSTWYAPAADLLKLLGFTELEDAAWNQYFYTRIVKNSEIATGYRVPVLMYHAVSDNIWGIPELFVSPANMEAQLKALVQNGYTAITFEDLDHISSISKPVMLTFDDGYLDNYTELYPLLKKYNVKATFFVIVDAIGNSRSMTKAQLKELSDSGLVSIQSHTMTHGYLDQMNASQLEHETYDSMLAIARITGKQPFVLCYPSGRNSALARSYTAKYYQYGLCMGGTCYRTGAAPYLIYRYYISRTTSTATFLAYLHG